MNVWSNPDASPTQDVATMAAFLEARGQTPDQQRLYAALVAALNPQPGASILDVGCGTGMVARRLAERVEATGTVVGLDISPTMVEIARAQGQYPALRFEQGDALALPFGDNHFDAASAARLLLHIAEPVTALIELRRVVRPGGRLAVLEWDWGTLAIDHGDRAITRRILDWRCDHVGGNNWMGRQLPRMCSESGWRILEIQPLVSIARQEGAALLGSLRRAADAAVEHAIISRDEHTSWIDEIAERLTEGTFFATINDYLVIAQ